MKMRVLLVILFTSTLVFAEAQICKYIVNEKDPLTDDVIRTIRTRLTAPTPFYYFTYIRNGSDYKFKVEIGDFGNQTNKIPQGSELILRAGNGDIFKMQAIEEAVPETTKEYSTVLTKYEITYQTSEEAMRAIEASGIMFIRISDLQNSFKDQQIPEAVIEISKANAVCLFK